jgi:Arm DNA-binding domain
LPLGWLTDPGLRALPFGAGQHDYPDRDGLSMRVAGKTKTFMMTLRESGKRRHASIDRYRPEIALGAARVKALALRIEAENKLETAQLFSKGRRLFRKPLLGGKAHNPGSIQGKRGRRSSQTLSDVALKGRSRFRALVLSRTTWRGVGLPCWPDQYSAAISAGAAPAAEQAADRAGRPRSWSAYGAAPKAHCAHHRPIFSAAIVRSGCGASRPKSRRDRRRWPRSFTCLGGLSGFAILSRNRR